MKKKVLSVILSTAMIASVLAGCGGGSEAPAADGGSAEAEAPAADGGSAEAEAPTAAAQRQKRRQQILRQAVRKRLPGCSGMI